MKKSKIKTITVSDEVMDKFENAFKKLRKQGIENEKKNDNYYIPFPDSKLKSIFGFTDEEIEELHKSSK